MEHWGYRLKQFLADAAYDAFEIYQYVYAKETPEPTRQPAKAYIALNSRGYTRLNRQFSEHSNLICEADLEMTNGGRWFDKHKGYHRQKFTCPLVKLPGKYKCGNCPINHKKFQKNGCQRIFVEQAFSSIKEHYDIFFYS